MLQIWPIMVLPVAWIMHNRRDGVDGIPRWQQILSLGHCMHIFGIYLSHWGRVTHICVGKLPIIDSDNGLSHARRQAIIWPNAGILLIRPLGTNFSEILIGIHTISFTKMHLKISSSKWRPFCLGPNVLIGCAPWIHVVIKLQFQYPMYGAEKLCK